MDEEELKAYMAAIEDMEDEFPDQLGEEFWNNLVEINAEEN